MDARERAIKLVEEFGEVSVDDLASVIKQAESAQKEKDAKVAEQIAKDWRDAAVYMKADAGDYIAKSIREAK